MKESPYWWDTASADPLPTDRSSTETGPIDVAIVGAGYTGLSAARQLARAGARVVVLERNGVGWGASSRNAGQVLTGLRLEPAALVAGFGEAGARVLFNESLTAIAGLESLIAGEGIECDYKRTGHIQAAWKPSHFEAFREEQALLDRVFGHRVTLVPRDRQASEIASEYYHGLLIDDRSAALNPSRYVRGLAEAASRAGATIREQVAVTRMTRRSAGWRLSTSVGDVDAGDVLLATNGYTDSSAPALQRRLIPIGSYIVVTEPLGPVARTLLPHRRMAFDSKHFLYYFRVTADDRLLFGGRAEFGRVDAESTRRAAAVLQKGMAQVFPQIANARIDYSWSGNVAFTRDEMPHAGRLDGAWFAGGYAGHGIAMATHLGSLIARRIAGEPIEHPLFDDRFRAIPLYRGRPWFLPFVGAYYRLKDMLG